jgi:hypothetical protein
MDIFDLIRTWITPPTKAPMQMNQPDLDPVDPATGQLLPGGVVPTVQPVPGTQPANTGLGAHPLNAQEALEKGDPKLIEFMRQRRGLGAVPAH